MGTLIFVLVCWVSRFTRFLGHAKESCRIAFFLFFMVNMLILSPSHNMLVKTDGLTDGDFNYFRSGGLGLIIMTCFALL